MVHPRDFEIDRSEVVGLLTEAIRLLAEARDHRFWDKHGRSLLNLNGLYAHAVVTRDYYVAIREV